MGNGTEFIWCGAATGDRWGWAQISQYNVSECMISGKDSGGEGAGGHWIMQSADRRYLYFVSGEQGWMDGWERYGRGKEK